MCVCVRVRVPEHPIYTLSPRHLQFVSIDTLLLYLIILIFQKDIVFLIEFIVVQNCFAGADPELLSGDSSKKIFVLLGDIYN